MSNIVHLYDGAVKGENKVRLTDVNGILEIRPEGYGDANSYDGEGTPIIIERWNGELRVVIWADIKQEDPTHIISLEGARESIRKEWTEDQR